jgi:hypothetical protein
MNEVMHHRLTAGEHIGGDRRGCDFAIFVVDLINVLRLEDVHDVCVAYVRDIYQLQVLKGVVIPREERLIGTKRKPRGQLGPDTNADGEPWPTDEGDKRRRVHRKGDVGTRQPAPH